MNLFLARHGEAVATGGVVLRDADRPLSVRGEEDAALMGRVLARICPNLQMVVTSPLLRAVRTGEIMGNEIGSHPVFSVTNHLAPGFRHKSLLDELMLLASDGDILAVGHQPDLSAFIAFLVSGAADASVGMPPGAVARLTVRPGRARHSATLEWLLTPQLAKSVLIAG
jgi:phosphohistidine phosphatase